MMINTQRYTTIIQSMGILLGIGMVGITAARWFTDMLPETLYNLYMNITHTDGLLPHNQIDSAMPLLHRFIALCIDSIGLIIFGAALITLMRIFSRFNHKEYFSASVITSLHRLTKLALAWALYNPLKEIILSVVTTLHKGPGNRIIGITFGTNDIINIVLFASLLLITALMQEGSKIQHEHDLTI